MIGQMVVGKYKVEGQLGSGAMGTIYKAEQVALGKTVVIKLLHKHLLSDPELIQRFHREARAASRLNHPNCVQIIDFGTTDDGSLYIAMEYIQGIDLATLLERSHPVDLRRLIHIIKQVCQALDEAHANGVLHRDLKPENIMIENRRTAADHVKVVDFGIAKLEENNPNSKRSFQTRTGIVCGTPEYMSPEQARGQKLDGRSDMYAIGVMLYHMVTDRLPFEASSPIEVVTKHISEAPVPPITYRKDLPESFDRLILSLLEKDREKRPGSAMDVHAELERIDRELAAARREKIEVKESDDATQVDMRPISMLVDAIDQGSPVPPQAEPKAAAQSTPSMPATRSNRGSRPVPAPAPAAQEPEGQAPSSHSDTIPENAGRALSEKLSALMGRDVRRSDLNRPAPPREAADRAATEPAPAPRGLVAPSAKARPSAVSLHDNVTVEVSSVPPARKTESASAPLPLRPAAPQPVEAEVEAKPKRSMKLWLIVGGLAIAAGVGAVLALTLP
ncbi:MAG: protein kinase [Myxococcota bacterium]